MNQPKPEPRWPSFFGGIPSAIFMAVIAQTAALIVWGTHITDSIADIERREVAIESYVKLVDVARSEHNVAVAHLEEQIKALRDQQSRIIKVLDELAIDAAGLAPRPRYNGKP